VLLATIGYGGQLASPASPAFDHHHPDAAPSEYDANEAEDDKLIDAGEGNGRVAELQARVTGQSTTPMNPPSRQSALTTHSAKKETHDVEQAR
jgi:hypothetical protein